MVPSEVPLAYFLSLAVSQRLGVFDSGQSLNASLGVTRGRLHVLVSSVVALSATITPQSSDIESVCVE